MIAALYCLTGGMLLQHLILLYLIRRHEQERKDLLNRIMARDYNEYANTVATINKAAVPQRNSYKDALIHAERMRDDDEG